MVTQVNYDTYPDFLSDFDMIHKFMAFLICSNHWILVIIVPNKNTIYYMDSLRESTNAQVLTHLQQFMDRY